MIKTVNSLSQYMLTADKSKTLTNGEIYTKVYISCTDIDESVWLEVDDSEVPENEEISDSEALSIIMGGATDA